MKTERAVKKCIKALEKRHNPSTLICFFFAHFHLFSAGNALLAYLGFETNFVGRKSLRALPKNFGTAKK